MLNLYRVTAFLSAALLFLAQPMFARQVLPLVGGAPAVWNTCQVFFQVALLAGYLYADASTRWLGVQGQSKLHLLLVLLPLVCLPLAIGNALPPDPEANPSPWLLVLMATTVGPPFLALSATAPLVQRWFVTARRNPSLDPYSLYVMSNFGSLVALLAYPLLIEPTSTLRTQAWLWASGYGIWIICLGLCGYFVWTSRATADSDQAPVAAPEQIPPSGHRKKGKRQQATVMPAAAPPVAPILVTWRRRLHWLALAGVPVAWMLGATTWITTDIAPVPLLWIVPLAVYLITYIIAFSERGTLVTRWAARILPWMMCALVASLTAMGIWQLALVHIAAFAVGAMVCHGQLARLRPGEEQLTEFYVWLSVGGALGGTFIAIVAPLVFVVPLEYPLAVAAGFALRPRQEEKPRGLIDLVCISGVLALLFVLRNVAPTTFKLDLLLVVLLGFPLLAWFNDRGRNWAFAAVLCAILAIDIWRPAQSFNTLRLARSYFGVHRVTWEIDSFNQPYHKLEHGTTTHGMQFLVPSRRCEPLVYYHRSGPLGEIMEAFQPQPGEKQHIAAVGLGTGAVACYTDAQRDITFFEIDHVVRELAENPQYFTYLSECAKGRYEIRIGDGRRMLAQEPAGRFKIMLLDAFASDAIPVHLLTREALALYMSRLTQDGILVFHISNNHLDLSPVLADLAHEAGWTVRGRADMRMNEEDERNIKAPSTYVVITREREHLRALAEDPRWRPIKPSGRAVWTDEFSNVLSVLK